MIYPQIHISKNPSMVYEPLDISVSGLAADVRIDLILEAKDENDLQWASKNQFVTSGSGLLELKNQAPEQGTYTGVDPMGIFWSMTPENEEFYGFFAKSDVEAIVYTLRLEVSGREVALASFERNFQPKGVTRELLTEDGLVGEVFFPEEDYPNYLTHRTGLIVVGGSGGGLPRTRAAVFAAQGYPTMALGYFAMEGLPNSLCEIPLEYFERATHYFKQRLTGPKHKIAFYGGSRGGELTLLLGSRLDCFSGLIAGVPSGYVWGGFGESVNGDAFAWTHKGPGIPYMPSKSQATKESPVDEDGIALTPLFMEWVENATEEQKELARISVENISCP